jgi:hypothetical protein
VLVEGTGVSEKPAPSSSSWESGSFHAGYLLSLLLDPEDVGSRCLRNDEFCQITGRQTAEDRILRGLCREGWTGGSVVG